MTKFQMPKEAEELMGFVPFIPNTMREEKVMLSFLKSYIKLSHQALVDLGMPDWILVLVDYNKARLAVMPC